MCKNHGKQKFLLLKSAKTAPFLQTLALKENSNKYEQHHLLLSYLLFIHQLWRIIDDSFITKSCLWKSIFTYN